MLAVHTLMVCVATLVHAQEAPGPPASTQTFPPADATEPSPPPVAPATAPAENSSAPPGSAPTLPPGNHASPNDAPPVAPAAARPPGAQPSAAAPAPNFAGVNDDPEVRGESDRYWSFYSVLMLFGTVYGHIATYEFTESIETDQSLGGFGYEVATLTGATTSDIAIGAYASFVHVPKAELTYHGDTVPGTTLGARQIPRTNEPLWAAMLGVGIDYPPGSVLRIGGMLGLAVTEVPKYRWPTRGSDTMVGGGGCFWIGADWAIGRDKRLGVRAKFVFQSYKTRDLEGSDPLTRSEGAAGLGLGATLSFL